MDTTYPKASPHRVRQISGSDATPPQHHMAHRQFNLDWCAGICAHLLGLVVVFIGGTVLLAYIMGNRWFNQEPDVFLPWTTLMLAGVAVGLQVIPDRSWEQVRGPGRKMRMRLSTPTLHALTLFVDVALFAMQLTLAIRQVEGYRGQTGKLLATLPSIASAIYALIIVATIFRGRVRMHFSWMSEDTASSQRERSPLLATDTTEECC